MKTATACKLSEPISTVAEVTATRPRDARSSTIDAPTRREPVDDVLQLALDCGLEIAPVQQRPHPHEFELYYDI